jgi:hypothetical protein
MIYSVLYSRRNSVWYSHVFWMGENKNTYKIWRMNLLQKEYLEVWDKNNSTLKEIVSFLCKLNLIYPR